MTSARNSHHPDCTGLHSLHIRKLNRFRENCGQLGAKPEIQEALLWLTLIEV